MHAFAATSVSNIHLHNSIQQDKERTVRWKPNDATGITNAPQNALPNPPGRIGTEPNIARGIKAFGGGNQTNLSFLEAILQGQNGSDAIARFRGLLEARLLALGNGRDQSHIGLDEAGPGLLTLPNDPAEFQGIGKATRMRPFGFGPIVMAVIMIIIMIHLVLVIVPDLFGTPKRPHLLGQFDFFFSCQQRCLFGSTVRTSQPVDRVPLLFQVLVF